MGITLQSNIIYYQTKQKLNHYNVMKQESITSGLLNEVIIIILKIINIILTLSGFHLNV